MALPPLFGRDTELAVGPVPVADPLLLEAELIDETVHVFARSASVRPLVLGVKDLQFVDQATIRLLHVLGRRLTGVSGVVLTAPSSLGRPAGACAAVDCC
jgi:hypothetical protein